MKFESILEEINGFGPFQIIIIVLLCSPRIVLPLHFLLSNFIAVAPPHRCDISSLDDGGVFFGNLTQEQKLTVSIPAGEDGGSTSCEMFAEPQFQLLSNSSSSSDLQTVQCQSGWIYDNSTFTSTPAGIEWVDTDHRSFISVIGGLAWCAGNMLLAGFAFLVSDWRTLTMIVTAPLGFAVLTWWWVPESARWLLVNGKVEQAQYYLDRCAKVNKRQKMSSNLKLENLANINVLEKQDRNYSYLDLIRTPKLRKLTLQTGIIWYGVASTYYCISMSITGFGLNLYLTHFIYAAIELPAKLMVYWVVNVFGRGKCQAGALILTATCVAINIFMPKDLWHVRAVVAVLGKGLSEAAFTTVFLYTTELYPTVIRQNGLGYTNFVSRLGVSMAPLILMLEDVWTLFPQVIVCFMALTSGLVALLLPETLNVRLPETIDDIENPRTNDGASQTKEPSGVFLESKSKTEETSGGHDVKETSSKCPG